MGKIVEQTSRKSGIPCESDYQTREYVEALWWLMHHSNDPLRQSCPLACYIDDSGTHDNAHLAVIGGPVFRKEQFTSFHLEWDTVLERHKFAGPVHMREFGGPWGKFFNWDKDAKMALFGDLVEVINRNKLYSVSASVLEQDFREFFPKSKFARLFGPAPLAFIWCMAINLILRENAKSLPRMAYLVAHSDDSSQMLETHSFIREYAGSCEGLSDAVGSMNFDSPKNVYALQAADMVAWSNRRRELGQAFDEGFEPLQRLTRHVPREKDHAQWHYHIDATRESTQELADIINSEFPKPPTTRTIKGLSLKLSGSQ